jgi:hypothetical protein
MSLDTACLVDREHIRDALYLYARSVDRRDWELVRSTYHADAYDDHGDFKGGVDGFIDWVSRRHATIDRSMHFLGNCLIEFFGPDRAFVETYFGVSQRMGSAAAESLKMLLGPIAFDPRSAIEIKMLGRYVDLFERRSGEWKTARRVVVFESINAVPLAGMTENSSWVWSRRDSDDAAFTMRAAITAGSI